MTPAKPQTSKDAAKVSIAAAIDAIESIPNDAAKVLEDPIRLARVFLDRLLTASLSMPDAEGLTIPEPPVTFPKGGMNWNQAHAALIAHKKVRRAAWPAEAFLEVDPNLLPSLKVSYLIPGTKGHRIEKWQQPPRDLQSEDWEVAE